MSMTHDDRAGSPRYRRIADWLRSGIETGELAPRARLPSEIALARRFGVSRETVRSALDRLVRDGYVFRRAGKGTFVAARRIDHPGSTQSSLSKTLDALGLPYSTDVLVARVMPADHHVARALRLGSGADVVRIRRLRRVEGEPVALHTTCLPSAFRAILDHDLEGSMQELLRRLGVPIVAARDSLQAVHADEEEARILAVAADSPLLRLEGIGIDRDGTPLRHTESLHRADRFRMTHDSWSRTGARWELKGPEHDR